MFKSRKVLNQYKDATTLGQFLQSVGLITEGNKRDLMDRYMNPQLVDFNKYILGIKPVVGENDNGDPTIDTGHHQLNYENLVGSDDGNNDLGSIESIPYDDQKLPALEQAAAEDLDDNDSDDDDDEFNKEGNNGGVVGSEKMFKEDLPSGIPKLFL